MYEDFVDWMALLLYYIRMIAATRTFVIAGMLAGCVAIGTSGGFFCGKLLKNLYLTSGLPLMYLFAEPEYEYFYIRSMVDSEEENARLLAYYAVKEYGRGNTSFFIERFTKEKSTHVKRALVWMLGFSKEKEEVLATFGKYYSVSDKAVQKAMRESAMRLGIGEKEFSEKFIK
jgi:hypothetical protein